MLKMLGFPLLILFYAGVSAYGLYLIKAASQIKSIDFAIGFGLYGLGFLIWIYILRLFPLSIAFPTAAGALIIATQFAGVLLLKEALHLNTIIGIVFVGIGIVLIYSNIANSHG